MKKHELFHMASAIYKDGIRYSGFFQTSIKPGVSKWKNIQYLGDLRNLCDHSKDREPTNDDVEELINGTSKIIKTVF